MVWQAKRWTVSFKITKPASKAHLANLPNNGTYKNTHFASIRHNGTYKNGHFASFRHTGTSPNGHFASIRHNGTYKKDHFASIRHNGTYKNGCCDTFRHKEIAPGIYFIRNWQQGSKNYSLKHLHLRGFLKSFAFRCSAPCS